MAKSRKSKIVLKITEVQSAKWFLAADAAGMPLSEWCKQAIDSTVEVRITETRGGAQTEPAEKAYAKQLPPTGKTDEQREAAQSIARRIIAIKENPELYNDPVQNLSFIQSTDSCRIVRIEMAAGTPPVITTCTYEPDKRLRHAEIAYANEKGDYITYQPEPEELEALRTLATEHLADLL